MAGSSVVEAMLSRSAPVFYGDIRSHERVICLVLNIFVNCMAHLLSDLD